MCGQLGGGKITATRAGFSGCEYPELVAKTIREFLRSDVSPE